MRNYPFSGWQEEIAENLKVIARTTPDKKGRWSWRVEVGDALGAAVLFVITRNYFGGKRLLGLDTRTDSDLEAATSERYLLYGDGGLAAIARINHQPEAVVNFAELLENGMATISEGCSQDYGRLVSYFRCGVAQCVLGFDPSV